MFTGIVQDVGEIASIIPREGDVAIEITLRRLMVAPFASEIAFRLPGHALP